MIRVSWEERECGEDGKADVQTLGSTHSLHLKISLLSVVGAGGIPCVAGKCVDIRRNTSGEGGLLDNN